MAAQKVVISSVEIFNQISVTYAWDQMGGGDVGSPVQCPGGKMSIQFSGEFDTHRVVLEGSNDGENYDILRDDDGSLISRATAGIISVRGVAVHVRPRVLEGAGNPRIVATLVVKR